MGGAVNMLISGAQTVAKIDEIGKTAQFQLNQDQRNIQLSQYASEDATNRGATAAGLARGEASKLSAEQKVAYVNSGVDSSIGTAANVQAGTAAGGEYDAMVASNNAAREAWGHDQVTANLKTQKDINIQKANNEITSTILGGLASGVQAANSGGGGKYSGSGGGEG